MWLIDWLLQRVNRVLDWFGDRYYSVRSYINSLPEIISGLSLSLSVFYNNLPDIIFDYFSNFYSNYITPQYTSLRNYIHNFYNTYVTFSTFINNVINDIINFRDNLSNILSSLYNQIYQALILFITNNVIYQVYELRNEINNYINTFNSIINFINNLQQIFSINSLYEVKMIIDKMKLNILSFIDNPKKFIFDLLTDNLYDYLDNLIATWLE